MEIRQELHEDLTASLGAINKEFKTFNKHFKISKTDTGLVEYIGPKNPKTILVAMGSVVGTIKDTIKTSNDIGILKIKCFRPFPADEIIKILKPAKNMGVIDKSISLGHIGPLASDIKAMAQGKINANISSFIVGLGGRDVMGEMIKKIIKQANKKINDAIFIGK
jgi:pyruvate/2-oxoacid:ferredoxin oxidoreductase alpha subunit